MIRWRLLALLLAVPAWARKPPPLPPLPPLVLPLDAPVITASISGKPVRLRVDPGGETYVALTAAAMTRLDLAGDWPRTDGKPPRRGDINMAIGQLRKDVPFSVEALDIAGRPKSFRVVATALDNTALGGADGEIGVVALPHDDVVLQQPGSHPVWQQLPARWGNDNGSGTLFFAWPAGGGQLEVELHPFRAISVASVAAASRLAKDAGGHITGPRRDAVLALGFTRPVRTLVLGKPVDIAGARLRQLDVRLFDWSGRQALPPDADDDMALTVAGRHSRQREWPVLRLGHDALAGCTGFGFHRQQRLVEIACPAP